MWRARDCAPYQPDVARGVACMWRQRQGRAKARSAARPQICDGGAASPWPIRAGRCGAAPPGVSAGLCAAAVCATSRYCGLAGSATLRRRALFVTGRRREAAGVAGATGAADAAKRPASAVTGATEQPSATGAGRRRVAVCDARER